jgi:hypothetical protein
MHFVTRERARIDRIACAWLIRRFIDRGAKISYVPPDEVMDFARREAALPFDVPGVDLGHHGERCSFDAFIQSYRLTGDQALLRLSEIVRGADTSNVELTPESAGLYAIASGFAALSPSKFADDHALLAAQTPLYDALYEYCRMHSQSTSA